MTLTYLKSHHFLYKHVSIHADYITKNIDVRKKIPILLFVFVTFYSTLFSQIPAEIQDPLTIGINKLAPRTAI